jgi:hypothetical protein
MGWIDGWNCYAMEAQPLACRSDCQVLIICQFDILALLFLRTPIKLSLPCCRRKRTVLLVTVETILQLVVWRISRWLCHAECAPTVTSAVLCLHFVAAEFYLALSETKEHCCNQFGETNVVVELLNHLYHVREVSSSTFVTWKEALNDTFRGCPQFRDRTLKQAVIASFHSIARSLSNVVLPFDAICIAPEVQTNCVCLWGLPETENRRGKVKKSKVGPVLD